MSPPRFFFVARVHAADADVGDDLRVGWRLLGRNNHEIARSADGFPDVDAAHDAVDVIRQHMRELQPSVSVGSDRGEWTWWMSRHGVPVAVASRTYRREREAVQSLEQFERLAPDATVTGGLRDRPDARRLVRPEFVVGPRRDLTLEEEDLVSEQDMTGTPVVELRDQDAGTEPFTGLTAGVQVEAPPSSSRPVTVSPVIVMSDGPRTEAEDR